MRVPRCPAPRRRGSAREAPAGAAGVGGAAGRTPRRGAPPAGRAPSPGRSGNGMTVPAAPARVPGKSSGGAGPCAPGSHERPEQFGASLGGSFGTSFGGQKASAGSCVPQTWRRRPHRVPAAARESGPCRLHSPGRRWWFIFASGSSFWVRFPLL